MVDKGTIRQRETTRKKNQKETIQVCQEKKNLACISIYCGSTCYRRTHVIVNVQPEVTIIVVTEIATTEQILNDETVEINFDAFEIENDIEEQGQVVEDEFEKNHDVEVVDVTCLKNDIHEHLVVIVYNDIEHE